MRSPTELAEMVWKGSEEPMPFPWMDVSFCKRITEDFLLHGRFCGVMDYDAGTRKFVGCTALAASDYQLRPVPFDGMSPLVSRLDGTPIDDQLIVTAMRRASPFDLVGTPYTRWDDTVTDEHYTNVRLVILAPFIKKASWT